MSALAATGTGPTVCRRKLNLDDGITAPIQGRCPARAGVALGAGGLLVFPIDAEAMGFKPLVCFRLPVLVRTGRTQQFDAVLLSVADQQGGITVSGIDQVQTREQILLLEGTVNPVRGIPISYRGRRRLDVSDPMGQALLAGFGQVDLVAHPRGRPFLGIVGLAIGGGINHQQRGGQALLLTVPAQPGFDPMILMDSDPAECWEKTNPTAAEPETSCRLRNTVSVISLPRIANNL